MKRSAVRTLGAMATTVAVVAGLGAGTASATTSASDVSPAAKLSHSQATTIFSDGGLTWSSSGNCSDRNVSTCTSFEQLNEASALGAVTLKSSSGCPLNVTGGTETGHADGTYSHWNGYKLDFSLSTCINNYITNNFTSIGNNRYESASGNIYFRESNHWDVTYYNCGGC